MQIMTVTPLLKILYFNQDTAEFPLENMALPVVEGLEWDDLQDDS